MNRRNFFQKALAVLAAPFVAKAIPSAKVHYCNPRKSLREFQQMLAMERLIQARMENEAVNRRQRQELLAAARRSEN